MYEAKTLEEIIEYQKKINLLFISMVNMEI